MKKESFNFLKTLVSLENCVKCVQNDVEDLLNSLPDNSDLDRNAIVKRANSLMFWLNEMIKDYDA